MTVLEMQRICDDFGFDCTYCPGKIDGYFYSDNDNMSHSGIVYVDKIEHITQPHFIMMLIAPEVFDD